MCASSASFACTDLELYIQVEENKSLVKMMLEYTGKQSWKKVKAVYTYIYIYIVVVCFVYT